MAIEPLNEAYATIGDGFKKGWDTGMGSAPPIQPTKDERGRDSVSDMTDRALAEETLLTLRAFADALQGMAASPMAAMMPGMEQFR